MPHDQPTDHSSSVIDPTPSPLLYAFSSRYNLVADLQPLGIVSFPYYLLTSVSTPPPHVSQSKLLISASPPSVDSGAEKPGFEFWP
jgi:hypothetical protein